ncbi:MAG: ISNCY family transposase, partial [bacterium]
MHGKIDISEFQRITKLGRSSSYELISRYKKYGEEGIIHGLTGKVGNHRSNYYDEIEEEVVALYKKKYPQFSPTLFAEYLNDDEHIKITHDKVREILIRKNLWKSHKRKREQLRYRRIPKEHMGDMIQYDGSYHKWFNDEEYCLLLGVDDATGRLMLGIFCEGEGVIDTFVFWKKYIEKYGKPRIIYVDKFSTYSQNNTDDPKAETEFERACRELDIELINAESPQAKGRVERSFGTLQDRLTKHLWLKNIHTLKEANEELERYLEIFNSKFEKIPTSQEDSHRKNTDDLDKIFSIKEERVIANDFVISYNNKLLQLKPTGTYAIKRKEKVIVELRLDNSIKIYSQERNGYINFEEIPKRIKKKQLVTVLKKGMVTMSPWRRTNNIFFKRKVKKVL